MSDTIGLTVSFCVLALAVAELPRGSDCVAETATVPSVSPVKFRPVTVKLPDAQVTVLDTDAPLERLYATVDPPRRLVQTFTALWSEEVQAEGPSRITYEIEPVGDSCRLTVTHDELREGAHGELYGGWPMILSGLKTLLETGELLTTPGSLRYVDAGAS